jgi:hypothetical protein
MQTMAQSFHLYCNDVADVATPAAAAGACHYNDGLDLMQL